MAKLSVQKAKAEKQLATMRAQLKKLDEYGRPNHHARNSHCTVCHRRWRTTHLYKRCVHRDKAALFGEVSSLEAQLAQAQADREESRNWASTYRDMLLKVT